MPAPEPKHISEWIFMAEAAEILGCSRQAVDNMVARGKFEKLQTIGQRPMTLLFRDEVNTMREKREAARLEREASAVAADA